jgi:NADH-quinone oxidoreductase subunit J
MADIVINVILVTAMVAAALYTVMVTRLLHSAIGLGITSAVLAVLIFRFASPLTAVFELSVCAGLISAIFISTISLTQRLAPAKLEVRKKERLRRFWLLPIVLIVAVVVLSLIHIPVALKVLAQPAENNVNIILWRLRHLDLVGQIVILLAGAFGVVTFFREPK